MKFNGFFCFAFISLLYSCSVADLRTELLKEKESYKSEYAKRILEHSVQVQGWNQVKESATYEVHVKDHWKGVLSKLGNPWGFNNDLMALRFSFGDFDGQVNVLEGEKSNFIFGIQSWNYYEKHNDSYDSNASDHKGKVSILAAIHYFFELPHRLNNSAPIIEYAGEKIFNGTNYDRVFISWDKKVNKEFDQYVLWISKKSGLVDLAQFTTRESSSPKWVKNTIYFEDYRKIDGVLIPFKHTVRLGVPKEKGSGYIRQLSVFKFKWNSFPLSEIRPFKELQALGDEKPEFDEL